MEIAATPPTTPPAMAPTFELLPLGEGLADVVIGPPVVVAGVPPVPVARLVPLAEEPELPISAPAPISGESPVVCDWVEFQLFWSVTSMRAHWGTLVPAGTGLGNVDGARVFEQLNEYSDHVIQFELWHASHALMREYATVLHLHKLESSTPLGPVYEYPGARELMVKEP